MGADGNTNSQIDVNLGSVNVAAIATNLGNAGASFEVLTPTAVTGAMAFTNGTTDVSVTLGAAGTYNTVSDVATALNADADFANTFAASVNADNEPGGDVQDRRHRHRWYRCYRCCGRYRCGHGHRDHRWP
ncbi:hypothetical protein GCM10025876_18780 [Demequina litorisediminis]|uniref:Uncharacterized protein n=1 Tax=Demequina litorisediminis TaxID=1849022 RepID=A0ABQ6ID96_9MICO|nr:hypothetical protein GCM10025876_18780 [Demequina litorisediminis]